MFPYSFNKFNNMYMNSGKIEEILQRPDCTIEDLLDEDEIIQEMKNQNTKLISFLDKEKVRQLVNYIIREPVEDDHKKGHKFPFTAAEILSCDVSKITEFFCTSNEEFAQKENERKASSISNADIDVVLSQDDHLNAFSNEEKKTTSEVENINAFEVKREPEVEINGSESSAMIVENPKLDISSPLSEQSGKKEEEMKRTSIDLLDHLLQFIESDKELNYVLAGYFAKFLIQLITKYPQKIITYIYTERKEILQKLIYHSEKKSIAELLSKVLLVENATEDKEKGRMSSSGDAGLRSQNKSYEAVYAVRNQILEALFRKLNLKEKDPEITGNIASICIDILEVPQIFDEISTNKNILSYFFSMLATDTNEFCADDTDISEAQFNSNYTEVLNIFNFIMKYAQNEPITLPTYSASQTENDASAISCNVSDLHEIKLSNTILGEFILSHIEKILKNFAFKESQQEISLEATYGATYHPLGIKRIKLVEIVLSLLLYFKNISSVFDRVLIKSEFLKNALAYFFEFEWNNMYQYHFLKMMKLFLNDFNNHSEIIRYMFEDLKLTDYLISQFSTENAFVFHSNRKINHGFVAVLIELCYKITCIGGGIPFLFDKQNRRGSFAFTNLGSNANAVTGEIQERGNPNAPNTPKIVTSSVVKSFLTPAWDKFYKERISYWVKLFEQRLCVQEQHASIENAFAEETVKHEEKPSETKKEEIESSEIKENTDANPFLSSRDANFFEDDNWMKKGEMDVLQIATDFSDSLEGFEFQDDQKGNSGSPHNRDGKILTERRNSLKVDELDEDNYNDANYWKGIETNVISKDALASALKDLEL